MANGNDLFSAFCTKKAGKSVHFEIFMKNTGEKANSGLPVYANRSTQKVLSASTFCVLLHHIYSTVTDFARLRG